MPKSVTIGARITVELDAELRQLAVVTGRSKSSLVAEAVATFVAAETDLATALAEGMADTVSMAEAMALHRRSAAEG